MTALAPNDAARLAKLLGMLGSDHAGERDAAALAAHKLIRARGLVWEQIVCPRSRVVPLPSLAPETPPAGKWQNVIAQCLVHPGLLRRWERDFLQSLRHFRNPSRKQKETLRGIAERVLGEGEAT